MFHVFHLELVKKLPSHINQIDIFDSPKIVCKIGVGEGKNKIRITNNYINKKKKFGWRYIIIMKPEDGRKLICQEEYYKKR